MCEKSKNMSIALTNASKNVIILKNRVVRARKVLQNGMSFANERVTCGAFTRPLSFAVRLILSVSL